MKDFFMINNLIGAMSGFYNPEYSNLTEEEKKDIDFVDECLYNENQIISNACSKIMFLILRYSASFEESPMSDEEFLSRKHEITKDLSLEEKDILDCFGYSLINTMGIYSEERVRERNLKMKGNDKNDKN